MNNTMAQKDLARRFRDFIACVNAKDWTSLGQHLHESVLYNGRLLSMAEMQAKFIERLEHVPDLKYEIDFMVVEPPMVAVRLCFNCTPCGKIYGLPVNGRRVLFSANGFYNYDDGRITRGWSTVDVHAIASQLQTH